MHATAVGKYKIYDKQIQNSTKEIIICINHCQKNTLSVPVLQTVDRFRTVHSSVTLYYEETCIYA